MKCIRCGRIKDVVSMADRTFFCKHCKILFDDDDDEGGDYSNNPTRRIERKEREKRRRDGNG